MAVVWPSKNNFANGDVLTATNMNNIGDTLNVFNPTSATNGQVWIANGAGSGSFQTPTSSAFTSLDSGTLSGTLKSSATISAVGYKWLYVQVSGITSSGGAFRPQMTSTPSSGTNQYIRYNELTGSTAGSGGVNTIAPQSFTMLASGGTNNFEVWWYQPTATTGWQYAYANYWGLQSAGTIYSGIQWVAIDRTAAITGFNFNLSSGGTMTGGTYRIYGVN